MRTLLIVSGVVCLLAASSLGASYFKISGQVGGGAESQSLTVNPGDVVTVLFSGWGNVPADDLVSTGVIDTAGRINQIATGTATGVSSGFEFVPNRGPELLADVIPDAGQTDGSGWFGGGIFSNDARWRGPNPELIASYSLLVGGAGTLTLSFEDAIGTYPGGLPIPGSEPFTHFNSDGAGSNAIDTSLGGLVINVTPEPASIALLGLGGLLLRRRRA